MELEWETRQPWMQPTSSIAQRRRSSAANARPAVPPPNQPIPSLPHEYPRSSAFSRPTASPNLSAVAAFSQARLASSSQMDDLSDPPPQSYLASSSFRSSDRSNDSYGHSDRSLLAPPTEYGSHRSENRPSSRRALTRALELAREAVQLDSTNDNPEAAVNAYAQSVALLSEVMERVRNGEDSTSDSHRRRPRRRSVAAQEEEVRRLQNIHDTYADRMNILSIIYSIPAVPYSTPSMYSNTTDTLSSTSPTNSTSPSSDSSPQIPGPVYTHYNPDDSSATHSDSFLPYTDNRDSVYRLDEAVLTGSTISGLPSTTAQHPYAVQYDVSPPIPQAQPPPPPPSSVHPTSRNSVISSRRARDPSHLPPKPPPPASSLPPAPIAVSDNSSDSSSKRLDPPSREFPGHRRTPSGLGALEEVSEETSLSNEPTPVPEAQNNFPRAITITKRNSPPLPPLPSPPLPPDAPGTPRSLSFSKPPPSPRLNATNATHARPRASSQVPFRNETNAAAVINPTTNQGMLYQRRKTSAPPSTRSPSPTESTTSAGSVHHNQSNPRSRSSSQPGRRPSLVGAERVSPDPPPPLPAPIPSVNGTPRKTSSGSKLNPNLPPPSLQVEISQSKNMLSLYGSGGGYPAGVPITPTSPLPPLPPTDPLLKPYHMMNLLRNTMVVPTGGYITRRLHVPCEVWSQGGAKLTNLDEKIRVVTVLCSALEDLEASSAEYFGAGNVSSGMALGIGSIGRREADAWLSKLDEFSNICDQVVANFGKKLGVGEGFVSRKHTWSGKLISRFDKFTNNGKNLDSPAAYVQGLKKLFLHTQLLDEHTRAILQQPIAPAYGAFPAEFRGSAEQKLKRFSEFFAGVVLTFVIRDLSQLLDKYVKKCEKWLAE